LKSPGFFDSKQVETLYQPTLPFVLCRSVTRTLSCKVCQRRYSRARLSRRSAVVFRSVSSFHILWQCLLNT